MQEFKYPDAIMRNYQRKPLKRRFRHNKYHAHKIIADGHKFDSKAEFAYYNLLKLEHKHFKCHPRFEILPHSKWNQKHNYTPDFCLYDGQGHLTEVDDIKGVSMVPAYDHLRMDLFSRKYHIPVTIVRKKGNHFVKKQRKTYSNS